MKEEVRRILKLVQDGKLSAEDAADLIEAFATEARPEGDKEPPKGETPPEPPKGKGGDPFQLFVDAVERLGKEARDVDWRAVAGQISEHARKGAEALRQGVESIPKGGFSGWFGIQEMREQNLPLAVPEGKTLRIENPTGDTTVNGTSELGSVRARATLRGMSAEDAKRKAAEYTLIIEESEHAVIIRQPDVPGLTVDLTVNTGRHVPVEVRVQSGDVIVAGTGAAARVSCRSGNVTLSGLDGEIDASSTSGNVKVSDSKASTLTLDSKSGNVTLTSIAGNISVKSASGNVRLAKCGGRSVAVDAVSGDVDVDLAEPAAGTISVHTVSGNAGVQVMDGSDCRVSLSSVRGNATCEAPLSDEAKTERRITGKLGDGNGTLDVSAVSGNVTLKLRDQSAQ